MTSDLLFEVRKLNHNKTKCVTLLQVISVPVMIRTPGHEYLKRVCVHAGLRAEGLHQR